MGVGWGVDRGGPSWTTNLGGFMRIVIGVIATVWLFIGGVAADQRGDFRVATPNCSAVSELSLTLAAGPLNYQGLNPNVSCTLPRPSA
jgi:hypothetical protein